MSPSTASLTLTSLRPRVTCRGRNGDQDEADFRLSACGTCYFYLFPEKAQFLRPIHTVLVPFNNTHLPNIAVISPDVNNPTRVAEICLTLNNDECNRWKECCHAASDCCSKQLTKPRPVGAAHAQLCPRTWDGYACWDDTAAGDMVETPCPTYISYSIPSLDARKECTENGTWYREPRHDNEWTNYTSCLNLNDFRVNMYLSLACNAVSLLVLVPSTFIFLYYRALRSQHRIRLHINLFISFILHCIVNILWETIVVHDRMTQPSTLSLMHRNTVACRMLYVMTRYSRSTNYAWMFCEAFYLHRLIVKAFEPPKRLMQFYILGWGVPAVPVLVYSCLRVVYANSSCWIQNFGHWEWLIYIPNLVALVANIPFLIIILRILLTQIQSHPNEPSNYRRALKAIFVLIPLFGLQSFLIIYKPPFDAPAGKEFHLISSIINNLQGLFVALIFCLCNGEVLGMLRRSCGSFTYSPFIRRGDPRRTTTTTGLSYTNSHVPDTVSAKLPETMATSNHGSSAAIKQHIALSKVANGGGKHKVTPR